MATKNLLYKSLINVRNITKEVFSLSEEANNSNKYVAKIGKNANQNTTLKRKSIISDSVLYRRKVESVRRKKQEGIIELSKVGSIFKAPGKALADTGQGILSRIMNVAGTVMAGWLVYNLPTIAGMAQELTARVFRLTQILGTFLPNITSGFSSFGQLIGAYAQNFVSLDFKDSKGRVEKAMINLQNSFSGMSTSFDEVLTLISTPLTEPLEGPGAPPFNTDYSKQGQGGTALPDQNSPEMYRIAAALSTEGSGAQSSADMMQVVVNRKATGRYGATYTDILAAPSQFAGVSQARSASSFKKIQTLKDASEWSGQSENTLLGIIKNIQDPSLQANAAKHVGGALEFRAQPGYYKRYGLVRGEMGPDGRFYNSAWRGGPGDNQFLKDPKKDPIRAEGPASFNLPEPIQPPSSKTTPSPRSAPPVNNLELIPQTGKGGFVQGGSSAPGNELTYATHFHVDLKTPNYTAEGLARIREVAFQAVKAMQARGSYVTFGNIPGYPVASKNDSTLRSQILQEQQGHRSRSSPGIDLQEHNSNIQRTFPSQPGSKTKFPFAVGSVYWRKGYGREAEIIGSGGVTVSHGGPGSSSSEIQSPPKPFPAQIQAKPRPSISDKISKPQESESYVVPFIYPQQQVQQATPPSMFLQQQSFGVDSSLNSFIDKKILLDLAYT